MHFCPFDLEPQLPLAGLESVELEFASRLESPLIGCRPKRLDPQCLAGQRQQPIAVGQKDRQIRQGEAQILQVDRSGYVGCLHGSPRLRLDLYSPLHPLEREEGLDPRKIREIE